MSDTNARSSFPILGVLGLIFITLKLTNFITWSWWWVLAPFWMPLTIIFMCVLVLAALSAIK